MRSSDSKWLCVLLFLATSMCPAQEASSSPARSTPAVYPGGSASALGQAITALVSDPAVSRAHWGVAVTAMDGTPVFGRNEGQFFRPASNMKLYTTAAAMHLLGPEAQVQTVVESTVPVADNGMLTGDLLLRGGGDANLSARRIPYETAAERKARLAGCSGCPPPDPLEPIFDMARRVAARVKVIHGDIVGDDTLWPWEPYAPDWSLEDDIYGDGPPVSALLVADGTIVYTVTPGPKPGDAATVSQAPGVPYFNVENHVKTVSAAERATVHFDHELGTRLVRMWGTVAVGKPYSNEVAVEDPAEYAATALKAALEANGVKVTGTALGQHRRVQLLEGFSEQARTPLPSLPVAAQRPAGSGYGCGESCPVRVTRESVTLADDVKVTLKVSQNLHAELMLKRLGKQYANDGSMEQGLRVVRQFVKNAGIDGDDVVLYDGSGLDSHDLVTPRATAKLLAYAATQPWFARWKASLPVGGEDGNPDAAGSMAGRFAKAPLKGHVFAKTGTLGESRALSGYLDCASGNTVIFSVMVDTHTPATTADRDTMDKILAAIAAEN